MLLQASGITSKSICPWYVVQIFNNNQEIIWSNIFGMFGQILNIPPNSGQIENFYDTYKFNQGDLFCRNIFSWQNNVARLSRSRQKKFIKISHFLFQKSSLKPTIFFKKSCFDTNNSHWLGTFKVTLTTKNCFKEELGNSPMLLCP